MTNFEKLKEANIPSLEIIKKMDISQFCKFIDKQTENFCNYCKYHSCCKIGAEVCMTVFKRWLKSEVADDDSM